MAFYFLELQLSSHGAERLPPLAQRGDPILGRV